MAVQQVAPMLGGLLLGGAMMDGGEQPVDIKKWKSLKRNNFLL